MENKEKYYYPCREDIREGYECEVDQSKIKEGAGWYASTLGMDYHNITFNRAFYEVAMKGIRVPFLTKEQIEAEGWVHIGGFFWEWPVKDTIYVDEFSNRTVDFRLNFVSADEYLSIDAYERNSFDWERVYAGPCPTINELRTLMRWFKIKK